MFKTRDALGRWLARVLPSGSLEEDNEGQLIIYTDLYEGEMGEALDRRLGQRLPGAALEKDNEGQLIIYTDLYEDETGKLKWFGT